MPPAAALAQHDEAVIRGHNRQAIFFVRENYLFFLRQWRRYVAPSCQAIAYCLMPTHYHVLLRVTADGLSHGMQLMSISYTKAVNKQQNRLGALFQGAFQSRYIERDEYLLHLSRYVHLNPVLAGLAQQPEDWEFSSYREYLRFRSGTLPVPEVVLNQFSSAGAYRTFVESYAPADRQTISGLVFDDD